MTNRKKQLYDLLVYQINNIKDFNLIQVIKSYSNYLFIQVDWRKSLEYKQGLQSLNNQYLGELFFKLQKLNSQELKKVRNFIYFVTNSKHSNLEIHKKYLNTNQLQELQLIEENPSIKQNQIAKELNKPESRISEYIKFFEEKQIIKKKTKNNEEFQFFN